MYPPTDLFSEYIIPSIFERIQTSRATNKKHIQRKGFSDLLKFLKQQGLSIGKEKVNLNELLVETRTMENKEEMKYFYSSFELFTMLENSG